MASAASASTDTEDEDLDEIDEIKADFKIHEEAWAENRQNFIDDIRFGRKEIQWPEEIRRQRELDGRPCLTLNQLHTFIFQVINSARQNKPGIVVHPVGSGADVEVAEFFNGLIRHIEQSSDGDIAYDTAMDCSVSGGFGFWRVNTRYACDDTFDQDIILERIFDASSVYPDAHSTAADSGDWNRCHILFSTPTKAFKAKYKGKDAVSFDGEPRSNQQVTEEDMVQLCERWTRVEAPRTITALAAMSPDAALTMPAAAHQAAKLAGDKMIVDMEVYEANQALFDALGMKPVGKPRDVPSYKVTQQIVSGAEVLETVNWAGTYIPIVPVWGEELSDEGKRELRSLIRGAKDAQRMYNYWKPLALDTPIPTPSGWTTMGEIQTGDHVFTDDGRAVEVVGKSPVHINRKCFRVEFDDGSSIVADAEHPWRVEERGRRTAAGFTWEMRDLTTQDLVGKKHFVPLPRPLNNAEAPLPVHPYVMGLWLGDGTTAAGRITPGDDDLSEVMDRVRRCGYEIGAITGQPTRHGTFTVVGLTAQLRAAGVLGQKHIPAAYLRASEDQRWQLLQGLMDSDGSIGRASGACNYVTTSPGLGEGFEELLRTLGIKAKSVWRHNPVVQIMNQRASTNCLPVREFYFAAYADEPVFGLARKAALLGLRTEHRRRTKRFGVVSVTPVASVPVQCLAIDTPSHLFLAGRGMIPTHNTTSTELVALAPKTPFIGRKGAFETDASKWATANTEAHAYIEYDGPEAPTRQPFASVPTGAIQEAASAQSDIKSIVGIFNSSIGAPSNETSGVAIDARDKQADTGSFHFTDNLSRAMRHCGRILLDLIPHVYSTARILRILKPDGTAEMVPVNQKFQQPVMGPDGKPQPQIDPQTGQPAVNDNGEPVMKTIEKMLDLTVGKYDLVVKAGPSFATQRDEIVTMCTEIIRVFPAAAPVLADIIFRNYDMPGADEVADRLYALMPQQAKGDDPRIQQGIALIKELQAKLAAMESENKALKGDNAVDHAAVEVKAYEAETKRMAAIAPDGMPQTPEQMQAMMLSMMRGLLADPDALLSGIMPAANDPAAGLPAPNNGGEPDTDDGGQSLAPAQPGGLPEPNNQADADDAPLMPAIQAR